MDVVSQDPPWFCPAQIAGWGYRHEPDWERRMDAFRGWCLHCRVPIRYDWTTSYPKSDRWVLDFYLIEEEPF